MEQPLFLYADPAWGQIVVINSDLYLSPFPSVEGKTNEINSFPSLRETRSANSCGRGIQRSWILKKNEDRKLILSV
jgi:hypothetical protein